MRHYFFGSKNTVNTALLIKDLSFNTDDLTKYYMQRIDPNKVIAFTLDYYGSKKVSAANKKDYLTTLLAEIANLNITTIYCCDAEYFKTLTSTSKAEPYFGEILPCTIKGYTDINVILGVNYQALDYNPNLNSKLNLSIETVIKHSTGSFITPGSDIIHNAIYPETHTEIICELNKLHQYPVLTCDIETFSLKFYSAGIGSIAFAWDKHNGLAFPVDYYETEPHEIEDKINYAVIQRNNEVRRLLKEFFTTYKGTLIWHGAAFDTKILTYTLWMNHLADYSGMFQGSHIMTQNFEDTKLITYLATNNTVKNTLKLKELAQPYTGNYAQEDIKNILLIPKKELLKYNLTDCLATWYVYEKYNPKMIQEKQEEIYATLFKPSVKMLLQVELAGMPIDPVKVQETKNTLVRIVTEHTDYLLNSPIIKDFHYIQMEKKVAADNAKLKTKKRILSDFDNIKFNPGSDQQLQNLIYKYLGYEVIDKTDKGAPAVGSKTLEKLINHAIFDEHKNIFAALIGLSKANKILTSFIPAFEQAQQLPDKSWRLYGNFNLGGTKSGRLSSSEPNLQNIPSGSIYGKLIKSCFISPKGWIFAGADFSALEAMIEALLSRDPNKMKVYTDGYDSHSLNSFAYFGSEMPDITNTVESINSIKTLYPKYRSRSKAPTFALQYGGTWRTIMQSSGLPELLSKQIENNYHELYKVSDAWIKTVLDTAHVDGYITGAFGLKIRTPILFKNRISIKPSQIVSAERRSAGNAKTQGYGLLNNRAAVAFRERLDQSPYKLDVLVVALIHDAIYVLIKDNPIIVQWVNDNLIDCMRWQELDELQHDIIKLGANLDLLWPAWNSVLTLPNDISVDTIKQMVKNYKEERNDG